VDALNGQPGIYTARYGGEGLISEERYELLLKNLVSVSWEKRTARFKSVIALAGPDGTLKGIAEGICEGIIATEPAGSGGFGYDPVFFLPEQGVTMAQLDSDAKHQISHRGRAMKAIEPLIRQVLQSQEGFQNDGGPNFPAN
jgi:XTP/dITP diphosphohydrolase